MVVAPAVRVGLVSVNVAVPAPLGMRAGEDVWSAIHKHPVTAATLRLGRENLEGDAQADRRVHGGPDKALFCYPVGHLRAWAAELGQPFEPGGIGENLTVSGWTEAEVRIGDVWRWGEARVQVAQPRSPCFKLAMRTGRPEMIRLFEQSGRSGWYLRVLDPGEVPTAGPVILEEADPRGLSVLDVQRLRQAGGADPAALEAAIAHPALAASWRGALEHRLAVQRRATSTADNPRP